MADLCFGHEFHDKIDKLAIVGNRKWEKRLAHVCSPFYARESQYFESVNDAFDWIGG